MPPCMFGTPYVWMPLVCLDTTICLDSPCTYTKQRKHLEVKLYSLEQYIGLIEDKLSSTTVDFFRSEGYLETKCLYWIREPKKC